MNSPQDALDLLRSLGAVPWLVRHHELVVEAAGLLVAGLSGVRFDRGAVLIGAALHDAGKIIHPDEMSAPGHHHEQAGRDLLLAHGVAAELARFCVTHAAWQDGSLEDQLVALADKLWKGKRDEALERVVVDEIATASGKERWEVFERVDALCETIAADGDDRLARSTADLSL
ncbi:MAG: HD domain-containing protein [Deltaproteobacteria bacterium]